MTTKSVFHRITLQAAPALLLALAAVPAQAKEFAQWGEGMVPMNSYGECWQAVDGIAGCFDDSDGDGVADAMDKCPDTPKGVKVDAAGCPLDTDGDGVADYKDKCPGTPKGVKVDVIGCPVDSDGDGVPDYADKCPGTPAGAKVDVDGCMPSIVLDSVLFQHDKAVLTSAAKSTLDMVASKLNSRPDVKQLVVIGHTDSSGPESYNMTLSQKRAKAVMGYLQAKGVSARMTAKGMGESSPVADNATKAGRAKNRRVVIDITM